MKRFLTIILSILLCVGVFVGCASEEEQKLLSQVEQLSAQIKGLQTEIVRLQTQVEEVQNQLNQTKNEMLTVNGEFISLEEAYESGFLTREDLMCISYYKNGEVWEGNSQDSRTWIEVDFIPQSECPSLQPEVENVIKKEFYKQNRERFFDGDGNQLGDEEDLSIRFFGEYDGSYVVAIDSSLWDYGAVVSYLFLDGLVISYTNPDFFVYCVL